MVWPISDQKVSFATHTMTNYPLSPASISPVHLTAPHRQARTEDQFAAMMIDEDDDFLEDEEDEEDDEEDSSVDEQSPNARRNQNFEDPKRLPNRALFLNFTSDLNPQKKNKKKSKPKKQTAYKVNGVNILNRNNLDSKTAIERIQRRRENHNHVERRRRDNINNTILELSQVVPNALQPGQKPNKGNILKLALDYIKDLQLDNQRLVSQLDPLVVGQSSRQLQQANSTPQSPVSRPSITQDRRQTVPIPQNSQDQLQYHHQSFPTNHYSASTPSLPTSPNPLFSRVFAQTPLSPLSPMHPTSSMSSSSSSISGYQYDDSQPGNPPPLTLPPQMGYSGYPGPNSFTGTITTTAITPTTAKSATAPTTANMNNGSTGFHSLPSSASSSPALSLTSYSAPPPQPTLVYVSNSPGPPPSYYSPHHYSHSHNNYGLPQPPSADVVNPTKVFNTSSGVPLRSLLPANQKHSPLIATSTSTSTSTSVPASVSASASTSTVSSRTSPSPPPPLPLPLPYLPTLRMSGCEKIYGGVCRY
ncbi:hypothetical protein F4703DRAFT_1479758 [Phycomyces blakesleeanus]